MSVKALEKLRSRILLKDIFVRGERMSHNDEAYERANGYANKLADEIEAEIAEKYMELPVDADGVPIHVGDTLECYANGYEGTFTVFAVSNNTVIGNHDIEWVRDNPDKWFHVALSCHRVKPLKLEELLNDYLKEREKIVRKIERSMITLGEGESEEDACDKLFAERIRDLIKEGGE